MFALVVAFAALSQVANPAPPAGGPPTTQAATTAAAAGSLPEWYIIAFFALLGVTSTIPVLAYILRKPQDPYSIARGFVGGVGGSTIVAALSTRVGGLPLTDVTWMEAVLLAAGGFLVAGLVEVVAFGFYAHHQFVKPTRRFGLGFTLRMLLAIFSGSESLKGLAAVVGARSDADPAWDEFAMAVVGLQKFELEEKVVSIQLFEKALKPKDGQASGIAEAAAVEALSAILQRPIEVFAARMSKTALNFSVWRVSADKPELEHLVSFPTHSLYEHKEPLPIWHDPDTKTKIASLAARSMLTCRYGWITTAEAKAQGFVPRGLGTNYDAVSCLPIPCRGPKESPWAVLCVENRDGLIPLESQTVRTLAGLLAEVVAGVEFAVRKRSIGDARLVSPAQKGNSPVGK